MHPRGHPRSRLIRQLRLAHAGERAAAFAYRGHAASVRDAREREGIRRIEDEEWDHRARVRAMLASLGARPAAMREMVFAVIGRVLGALCHVSPWYATMYAAGWIEGRNVQEYLAAAAHARAAGEGRLVADLMAMAEVEWQHERWFRAHVTGHWFSDWLPPWPALPAWEETVAEHPPVPAG